MYTYDLSTAIGQVRLLIPDRDEQTALFSDEELTAFLAMEQQRPKRAAAAALETAASDQALVDKVIKARDVSIDGAKVAAELRERAKTLRSQDVADQSEDAAEAAIGVIEVVNSPFAARERLWKQAQRGSF